MPDPEYCFIVNPAASGGLAGRNWPKFQSQLAESGLSHCHFFTEHKGHGQELARGKLQAGYKHFVAVGGDGTANEILNGLFSDSLPDTDDISMGVIPWGTGNDWARYYGLSAHAANCIKVLQSGGHTLQDIGRASFTDSDGIQRHHYFLNVAGTGFDSYLLTRMGVARGSRFRYFLYLLKCLREFTATTLHLEIDGQPLECPALMLQTCLGKYAGAGMQFAPEACAMDGVFDVLLIKDLSVPKLLRSLFYLYNGRINAHKGVSHWQSRVISVGARKPQAFQCDGELVGDLPVRFDILPLALRVMTP